MKIKSYNKLLSFIPSEILPNHDKRLPSDKKQTKLQNLREVYSKLIGGGKENSSSKRITPNKRMWKSTCPINT